MTQRTSTPGDRPALAFAFNPDRATLVFSESHLATLDRYCRVLDTAPIIDFGTAAARGLLAEAEILATGWGCPLIDRAVVAAAPRLKLIAHAAGTVKAFVADDVYEAGIAVTNAVAANAIPVAEYTLAAILFFNKRILEFRDIYRRQRTGMIRHPLVTADIGNLRKVIGVIGASRVGLRLIELLKPFDFTVLLHDPYVSTAQADAMGVELVSLDELMARSDVASLHAPELDSTRDMIDARRLALLRDGATFINTARGSLVDHTALELELLSGRISAVIDVTQPEVLPRTSALYDLPNVLLTPHIAGAIGRERERLGDYAVEEIVRFATGEPLRYRIAREALERLA